MRNMQEIRSSLKRLSSMFLLPWGYSSKKKLLEQKSARNQPQEYIEETIIELKSLGNVLANGMESRLKRNDELGYS
jgi:hypothetical protein